MYNKQIAKEIVQIIQELEKRNTKEIELYKSGEISVKGLILFVSDHYFKYKKELLKKKIFDEEQIKKTIKAYEETKNENNKTKTSTDY